MTQGLEGSSGRKPKQPDMAYQEIVDAWNRRSLSNRVGSRRLRRRLVIGVYGGWLVVALIARMLYTANPHFPVILVLLVANALVLLIVFGRRTYLAREVLASDAGLDERLVQNRNQAFRTAFRVFVALVLIAWPLSAVALGLEPGNQGNTDALMIYFTAVLVATTLPTAIWAWREPDPDEPESIPG